MHIIVYPGGNRSKITVAEIEVESEAANYELASGVVFKSGKFLEAYAYARKLAVMENKEFVNNGILDPTPANSDKRVVISLTPDQANELRDELVKVIQESSPYPKYIKQFLADLSKQIQKI